MRKDLYKDKEKERVKKRQGDREESYRTVFRRDYARVLHSPSFRRLNGKTQLFPGSESDFFRNRLTHTLEVAQVAKSIAIRFNAEGNLNDEIDRDLVEFAALAHDLGHPPFGHNGEEALDECIYRDGGFEGNAQTLRIISRLEKKKSGTAPSRLGIDDEGNDQRLGLNLTYRSLASVLKYDRPIPLERPEWQGTRKGYYENDTDLVEEIKQRVTGGKEVVAFKTIECSIMDVADDIAYSTYDLEDAFQAGFLQPMDLLSILPNLAETVAKSVQKAMEKEAESIRRAGFEKEADEYKGRIDSGYTAERVREIMYEIFRDHVTPSAQEDMQEESELGEQEMDQAEIVRGLRSREYEVSLASEYYRAAKDVAESSYRRQRLTSALIGQFIQATRLLVNKDIPALSQAFVDPRQRERIETLKHFTFKTQIQSPRLNVVEYRGKDIVGNIFSALDAPGGERLLPDDYRLIYDRSKDSLKKRVICDFVAGMTDRYALDYYARITSGDEQTIFKPH